MDPAPLRSSAEIAESGETDGLVHPGRVFADDGSRAEIGVERVEHRVAPAFVEPAQPSYMAFEVAVHEKVGERGLFDEWSVTIGHPLRRRERRNELVRHDDMTVPM